MEFFEYRSLLNYRNERKFRMTRWYSFHFIFFFHVFQYHKEGAVHGNEERLPRNGTVR